MQPITFTTELDGRSYDICINPSDFTSAYNVYELKQDGKHYQYIFQDKLTGEYFLGEDSKLTMSDVEALKPHIEMNRSGYSRTE